MIPMMGAKAGRHCLALIEQPIDDTRVSRVHAEVRLGASGYVLVDHGSRNGTRVNDHPVTQQHTLCAGDEIGVAGHRIRFEVLNG